MHSPGASYELNENEEEKKQPQQRKHGGWRTRSSERKVRAKSHRTREAMLKSLDSILSTRLGLKDKHNRFVTNCRSGCCWSLARPPSKLLATSGLQPMSGDSHTTQFPAIPQSPDRAESEVDSLISIRELKQSPPKKEKLSSRLPLCEKREAPGTHPLVMSSVRMFLLRTSPSLM